MRDVIKPDMGDVAHVEKALRETFEASLAVVLAGLKAYKPLGTRAASVAVGVEFQLAERSYPLVTGYCGKKVFK
jgi:hypothetical protein